MKWKNKDPRDKDQSCFDIFLFYLVTMSTAAIFMGYQETPHDGTEFGFGDAHRGAHDAAHGGTQAPGPASVSLGD